MNTPLEIAHDLMNDMGDMADKLRHPKIRAEFISLLETNREEFDDCRSMLTGLACTRSDDLQVAVITGSFPERYLERIAHISEFGNEAEFENSIPIKSKKHWMASARKDGVFAKKE